MSNKILVFCSVPTSECASLIANTVVQEELAACVTVLPGLSSVYRWRGEVESATEQLLLIKTSEPLFDKLRARILSLHPYEVPEVIATPITAGHAPYLEWIDQSTLGL
ncbi:MAG: divalent cation tolerance protein CutA [Bryobacterales bacterium]|nr:divalent cation tolerance protein CutA [Bryobacterales bacterium]